MRNVRALGYRAIEPGLQALDLHLRAYALDVDEQKRSGFRYKYSSYQLEYSRNLARAHSRSIFGQSCERSMNNRCA